jgi:hypothetical protein
LSLSSNQMPIRTLKGGWEIAKVELNNRIKYKIVSMFTNGGSLPSLG